MHLKIQKYAKNMQKIYKKYEKNSLLWVKKNEHFKTVKNILCQQNTI